jgi:hypothetical protein
MPAAIRPSALSPLLGMGCSMRRLLLVAALALALAHAATPSTASAQAPGQILETYTLSGCLDGRVRWELDAGGVAREVMGRIGCFGGTATLTLVPAQPNSGFPADRMWLRVDGALTATLVPEFTGSLRIEGFSGRVAGISDSFRFLPNDVGGFIVGSVAPQGFWFGPDPVPPADVLLGVGGLGTLSLFQPAQPLAPDPFGRSTSVTITFTPTPEPATLGLLAMGVFGVVGVARRQRRRSGLFASRRRRSARARRLRERAEGGGPQHC